MPHAAEKLVTLRDRLADARKGFEQAAGDARDASMRGLFARAEGAHADALTRLAPYLPLDESTEGGTLIGTVTKAVVFVRGAVAGDESLLPGMIDGERRVLEACDAARAAVVADPAEATALADIREKIAAVVADLEAARANAA